MIAKLVRGFSYGAVLALAGTAAAQEAPPATDSSQIVVRGKKDIDRDIRDFVGALAESPGVRQLSRFEREVCPVAVGLAPVQREAVAVRMRRVAEAAGLRVGSSSCVANVVVVVTDNKRKFLEALRRKQPSYFGELSSAQIRRLITQPGPAAAWQLQGPPISARGTEIHVDPSMDLPVNRTTEPASRITAPARPQFDAAVVVVESAALAGLTTTQLADYAAMRAYAGTDPSRIDGSTATTILKVLEAPMGSEVPASLTHWDLGFLRGLYHGPANLYAAAQRSAIRREVARQLETQATP